MRRRILLVTTLVALLFSSVAPAAAQAGGDETARADELRTQLNTHLAQALEVGYEIQGFGGRLSTTITPEKALEEAPQLLAELSQLETKLDLAQSDIDLALAIIDEAKGLNIPEWYRDYFAQKEQVANSLSTAFEEAEQLLPRVVPLLETMPEVYRTLEEQSTAVQDIQQAVTSMSRVGFEDWAALGQQVSELEQIVSAIRIELDRAYAKLPFPLIKDLSDLLALCQECCGLLKQATDAGAAGDVDRAQSLARQVIDKVQAAPTPEVEESVTWFMAEYGTPIEEFKGHLEQAGATNAQAEMGFGKVVPTPTPTPSPTPSPTPTPAPITPGRRQQTAQQFNQQLRESSQLLLSGLSPSISYQEEALRELQLKLELARGYLSQPPRSTLDWQLREKNLASLNEYIRDSLPTTVTDLQHLWQYIEIATDLGYAIDPQLYASFQRTEDTLHAADDLLATELPTLPELKTPAEVEAELGAAALRMQRGALNGELERAKEEYEKLKEKHSEWLRRFERAKEIVDRFEAESAEEYLKDYQVLKEHLADFGISEVAGWLAKELKTPLPGTSLVRKVLGYFEEPPPANPVDQLKWAATEPLLACARYYADRLQGKSASEKAEEWLSLVLAVVSGGKFDDLSAALTALDFACDGGNIDIYLKKQQMIDEQRARLDIAKTRKERELEQAEKRVEDLQATVERLEREEAQLRQIVGGPEAMSPPATPLEQSALGGTMVLEGPVKSILEEDDPRCSLAWQDAATTLDLVKTWARILRSGEQSLEYWRGYTAVDPMLGRQGEEVARELMRTAAAMLQLYLDELGDSVLEAREAWPIDSSTNSQIWNGIDDIEAKLREVLGRYPWLRVEVAELPVELEEISVELEEINVELEEITVELEELYTELLPLHTEVMPLLEQFR